MVRHDFHRVDRRSTIFEQRRSALFPEVAKSVFSATRHIWNLEWKQFLESRIYRAYLCSSASSSNILVRQRLWHFYSFVTRLFSSGQKRQMHCKERKNALEKMGSELKIPWSCLSIVCRVLLVQLLYICIRKKCSERFYLLWALF